MRYKLTIAYDGTCYCGWQVQKGVISISKHIQNTIEKIVRHPINLTGSGRTDAGVHANGQTAHFDTNIEISPQRLLISLNGLLPPDIRIIDIIEVPDDFHARYSALSKIFHYHLHLDPILDPFTKLYRHQVFGKFDKGLLIEGTHELIGTHDFTSFANVKEISQTDTVRTISRIDMVEQEGGIRLEFEGNGFLYKMVRNLTGALIDIAQNKLSASQIPMIIAAKDRRKAPSAAPAKGLFLHQVKYQ